MRKRVAVLIRDRESQYEGLRSSLGLQLEDHELDMFVLEEEIDPSEEYVDNMGFIDEMGGGRYSNVPANIGKHGFRRISLEETAAVLKDYDLIIPFSSHGRSAP